MSPWISNNFMNGCVGKMEAKVGNVGAILQMNGVGWNVVACLSVDAIVML